MHCFDFVKAITKKYEDKDPTTTQENPHSLIKIYLCPIDHSIIIP